MADITSPFNSRNTARTQAVTVGANPSPASPGGPTRLGEGIPPGVRYTAVLREWPNMAPEATENAGPEAPSANATMLPGFDRGSRRTGRL